MCVVCLTSLGSKAPSTLSLRTLPPSRGHLPCLQRKKICTRKVRVPRLPPPTFFVVSDSHLQCTLGVRSMGSAAGIGPLPLSKSSSPTSTMTGPRYVTKMKILPSRGIFMEMSRYPRPCPPPSSPHLVFLRHTLPLDLRRSFSFCAKDLLPCYLHYSIIRLGLASSTTAPPL